MMTFLAANWLFFLIGTGVFVGLSLFLQFRNMKSLVGTAADAATSLLDDDINVSEIMSQTVGGVFSRMKGVIFCSILAAFCGVLTVIGVIVAIVDIVQKSP